VFSKITRLINEGFKKAMQEDKEIEKDILEQEEQIKLAKERMAEWDKNTKLIQKK
jgi:hypothetical protein